ncbi:MAG: murein transglycosylase A [Pseudomonadota bacterium]
MKRLSLGLTLLLAACVSTGEKPADEGAAEIIAVPLSFSQLDGWETDNVAESLPVFVRSCEARLKSLTPETDFLPATPGYGTVSREELERLCGRASMLANMRPTDSAAARQFFESEFVPVRVQEGTDTEALFTGYFEPTYAARTTPVDGLVPVLARPDDLVMVNLGAFRPDLTGQRIAGKVEAGKLTPYATHEEIIRTPPETEALGYMNPSDLLFLQIQGSGRLVFEDGSVERVGYAAQNGHKYVPIGRTLVQDGELPLEEVTMQSIRAWLDAAPADEAARVRHSNPSYVFFTLLDNLADPALGPLGAQGVQLTPLRSLAVDDAVYRYGLPVWVEVTGDMPSQGLFIAQDTGGAITGAQRGDIFFGAGREASAQAGRMKSSGQMILLLPKTALPSPHHAP